MCAFNPSERLTRLCVHSHTHTPQRPDYAYVFPMSITVSMCASSYLPHASTQGISISCCGDGDRISAGEEMRLGINEARGVERRWGLRWGPGASIFVMDGGDVGGEWEWYPVDGDG